jgi:L,D-peptidoglycan transpeptidase YkuD (ErfK/YbiS/YcfS/YnhG family)
VRSVRLAVVVTVVGVLAGCGTGASRRAADAPSQAPIRAVVTRSAPSAAPATTVRSARHAPARKPEPARRTASARPVAHPTSVPSSASGRLPLPYGTGNATQVLTVVASSASSTRATVQRWTRAPDGWQRVGPAVPAYVGAAGMSAHPSESISATPEGSFTLTQAFGHDRNPGTQLPYLQTNPDDWWISQPGPLYNTHQRCAAQCGFTQGDPNEHLYYETPYYDYAVVIDYNTANAPGGVRQGAGSAFFLHVSVGAPTAGCVAVPVGDLIGILRWLRPARHPRILIGLA